MSGGPFGRLVALFVAPASGGAARPRARGASPVPRRRPAAARAVPAAVERAVARRAVAVLVGPDDVRGAAAAAGAASRGTVVLACWSPGARAVVVRRGPALPRAARLAASLVGRGVQAAASGRLVRTRLPDEPGEAVVVLRRLAAAAGGATVVLALAGPREAAWDDVLAEQDVVLVCGPDPALLELASDGLAGVVAATRIRTCAVPAGSRRRALRHAVRAALREGRR